MNEETKRRALVLLQQKRTNSSITYRFISDETGYSKRQLIRLANELDEKDMDLILIHGNTNRKSASTATTKEIEYICKLKEPYPDITISQFRDIFIEDVMNNPDRTNDIIEYKLKYRSKSWFRELFKARGWKSPAQREIRIDGKRVTHPSRKPRDHRGELIQIDGTSADWFHDGRVYTLHLLIDDATSEVQAGWFMPLECTEGYARGIKLILDKWGIPMSFYADKYSVFRSVISGSLSQFGNILKDHGIEMIFANSAQAKGRVERYNRTCQMRLPNDLIRFKVPYDYDYLNKWFNGSYIEYLNRKFAFVPNDPNDAYEPIPNYLDLERIFCLKYSRMIHNGRFSYDNAYYVPIDENGELLELHNKTKIDLYYDIFNKELYTERYGKHYTCVSIEQRKKRNVYEIDDFKDLNTILDQLKSHYK